MNAVFRPPAFIVPRGNVKTDGVADPVCTVLQLVLSLSPGGTERLVVELVRRLPSESFRTVVCCLDQRGTWGEELTREGKTVIGLNRGAGFQPSLASKIAEIAVSHNVDVIHCHHYSPYVYGQLAARRLPTVRVVFTEHGRLSDAGPSLKRWLANQYLARLPASVYTVSTDLKQHLVSEGFSANRVGVIPNGIDPRSAVGDVVSGQLRHRLGLHRDTFVVGTVGRLDPVKCLDVLLRGFAGFRSTVSSAVLLIVGEGRERERLTRLADTLGVRDDVRFLGHREDVQDLLSVFDTYVSTSVFEGISLTILEAMAAEVPVIATAVGGTPEVVLDGETGRLISPRRPEAVTSALRFMNSRPDLRLQWGKTGRNRVMRQFSIDGMVSAYADVYAGKD